LTFPIAVGQDNRSLGLISGHLMSIVDVVFVSLREVLLNRALVAAEVLAFRRQLIRLQRPVKQPWLQKRSCNGQMPRQVEPAKQG
jgi:hypothetical protein